MKSALASLWIGCTLVLVLATGGLRAADGPTKVLLDVSADGAEKRLTPVYGSREQVRVTRSTDPAQPGLVVTIQPGPQQFPGVEWKPEGGTVDLSAFGHVEARVTNTGTKALQFGLRVDNAGAWQDAPWNAEGASIKPGASVTVTTIFGYQDGHHPGFALNPAGVVSIDMFTGKSTVVQSFRIESLVAGGPAGEKPPVDPASVRIKPKDGVILGPGSTIDPATQLQATAGAKAELVADAGAAPLLRLSFTAANKGTEAVALKPPMGRWDLRYATEVRVKVKNDGPEPVTPQVQVLSNGGPTDLVAAAAPLAPGAEQEIVVPFAPAVPWQGAPIPKDQPWKNYNYNWETLKGTGTKFTSDTVSAIKVSTAQSGAGTLRVESVMATVMFADIPAWLGKRPPVPQAEAGQWVVTLDERFPGNAIDPKTWSVHGGNPYDKATHWTRDDVIVGDGVCRLRYEKKTGFHNDDPKGKQTPYAAGYLDSNDKWVQRYGYFEAKVKLPTAPGLWPGIWTMPDRGPQVVGWRRGSTADGGMELDFMEHLTRWGPYRYNIGQHWDGYQKEHKTNGNFVYVQTDKDGWITAGMLWTPGSLIYYCNGKEVERWEDPRVCSVPSHLLVTLPQGGWDNNPIDDKQLPADLVIQCIRVWQRKDLASSADGYHSSPPSAMQPATP